VIITAGRQGEQLCWPEPWTRFSARIIHRGPPAADFEAERIEWISLSAVPALIADGRIRAACTVAALLLLYHAGPG